MIILSLLFILFTIWAIVAIDCALFRAICVLFVLLFRLCGWIYKGLCYVAKPILWLLDIFGDFIISLCKFFGLRDKSDEKSRKTRSSIERQYEQRTNALISKIVDVLDGDGEEVADNYMFNIYYKKGDLVFVLGMNQYGGETHYFIEKIIEYRTPSYTTDFINKSDIMLLNRSPFVTELGKYFHAKCA